MARRNDNPKKGTCFKRNMSKKYVLRGKHTNLLQNREADFGMLSLLSLPGFGTSDLHINREGSKLPAVSGWPGSEWTGRPAG